VCRLRLPDYLEVELQKRAVEAARQTGEPVRNPIAFTDFKRAIYRRYQHAPHLQAIDEALTAVTRYAETNGREGIGYLIIEAPPRHGKSLTTSRLYPIWHLGRNPDHRLIMASYGADLATQNSKYARNMIASPDYQRLFPIGLAKDSKAANAWDIAGHTGGLIAVGVGGASAGFGGNVIVIDDPIKNREEAESPTYRDKIWNWFADDILPRREPGASICIFHTRWHMDDLIGRLLRREPTKWHELRLPAVAEENDILGRAEGEALWPERFPLEVLREIEDGPGGPYGWASLYQQRPTPAEGGLFKNLHIVDTMPVVTRSYRYWDLAMSSKTTADFTVGLRLDECADGHFYVSDVRRARLDWGKVPEFMAGVMLEDGSKVVQGIEEAGYMSRAVQDLNTDARFHHFSIWGYKVDKDKLTRALAPAAKMAAGTLHILRAHWTDDFCEELKSFPMGSHDDQVDSLSGAWGMVTEGVGDLTGGLNYSYAGSIPGAW
jgi:predicted phage terminase large subunit-like protein